MDIWVRHKSTFAPYAGLQRWIAQAQLNVLSFAPYAGLQRCGLRMWLAKTGFAPYAGLQRNKRLLRWPY